MKLSRIRLLPVPAAAAAALAVLTLVQFHNCNFYDYTHIPRGHVKQHLYAKLNPKLPLLKSKPDCTYDHILESMETLDSREVPRKFNDFSVSGLVNGSYSPPDCNPLYSVAILVPYRDRQKQLDIFLPYMHNFLRKQNIHYKIYVIEQQDEKPFNKGLLLNTGAAAAAADGFPCLVLQDVDVLPLDAANLHACLAAPRHMAAALDAFRFVLLYPQLVGGALAVRMDHFRAVDGFSHAFLGWGGEDDDFWQRLHDHQLEVVRLPREMSRYTALPHSAAPRGAGRAAPAGPGLAALRGRPPPLVRPHPLFTLLGVTT